MMDWGAAQLAFTTLAQSTCPVNIFAKRTLTAPDFLPDAVAARSDLELGERLAWNSAMLESGELAEWEREAMADGMFSVAAEARRELLQERSAVWRELDRRKLIRPGCTIGTGRYPELKDPGLCGRCGKRKGK